MKITSCLILDFAGEIAFINQNDSSTIIYQSIMSSEQSFTIPDKITDEFINQCAEAVPSAYHRPTSERIFVTRDTNMDSINFVGCEFDISYQ